MRAVGARPSGPAPGAGRVKRAGLLSLMSVTALNVYTGSPLLGLWVGSRVQGAGPPSMAAIAVVGVVFLATSLLLVRLLALLGGAYDRLTGRPPQARRHVPWLRSMRGERPHERGAEYRLSALDYLMIGSVVLLVAAFEVWFFFYSGSPIDGRTGRG